MKARDQASHRDVSAVRRCVVHLPSVRESRVDFSWTIEGDNPLQHQTRFHLTLPGLDLAVFSVELWLEIFLALQLKVFARLGHPIWLELAEPLPEAVVHFWRAFHRATLVDVHPRAAAPAYSPTRLTAPDAPPARRNALFYGGGKDSLVGALLLAELEGADDLLLVNFAAPGPGHRYELPASANRETTILAPARRRLGIATAAVVTDYQTIFTPGAEAALPHVELYTAGALPWLIHYGVRQAFFTYGRNAYRVARQATGELSWSFATSRREILVAQSAHYRQHLGLDLEIANAGDLLTNFASYHVLTERYPSATDLTISCGLARPGALACGACAKCLVGSLLALACGRPAQVIPIEAVLADAPRVTAAVADARAVDHRPAGTNLGYSPHLTSRPDFPNILRAIALADPRLLDPSAHRAADHLAALSDAWGHDPRPDTLVLSRASIEGLRLPTLRRMADLLAHHLPLVDAIRGPFGVDGLTDNHGVDEVMPLHPHLAALAATHPAR